MRGLVFHDVCDIRVGQVDEPSINDPRDAIVKVTHSAICGSDLHVYHGREQGLDRGTVMGHEFVGEIVETGSAVHGLEPGMRVFSPFTTNCGSCRACRSGLTCRCEASQLFGWVADGCGLHGAQTEYLRVALADSTLKAMPPELSPELALLLGDVLSTGAFCCEQAEVGPGDHCVVIGCGPVGLMALVAARWRGAEAVYAIDLQAERREWAERWGAVALHPQQAIERGIQVDRVMEAVGHPSASRLAYQLVRPGGVISIVGVHTEPHFAITPSEAYDKNLTLRIGRCPARRLMDELVAQAQLSDLALTDVFTHRLTLEDGPDAYRMFDEKRDGCLKVLLTP